MQLHRTSRKDDIISIFYMMVYLLSNNKFACFQSSGDAEQQFAQLKDQKQKYSLELMVLELMRDHLHFNTKEKSDL